MRGIWVQWFNSVAHYLCEWATENTKNGAKRACALAHFTDFESGQYDLKQEEVQGGKDLEEDHVHVGE